LQIHLIDGTYELFRMFYGAPRVSVGAQEVGATRALLRNLATMLRRPEVTHVAVAFDTVIESFRNELFAGYKTGAGMDPELWSQFPLAEQAAAALGICVLPMRDFEADDGIATGAAIAAPDERVTKIWLCSPDKDLCQCVDGERVVLRDRRQKKTLDAAGVKAKFGVPPAAIPDLLALVGDTADGIPGIPRWGRKSAAKVLTRYERLEDIPGDPKHWDVKVRGATALSENLEARREQAALYKTLATLRRDAKPDIESVDAIEWKGVDETRLAALCQRIADPHVAEAPPRPA